MDLKDNHKLRREDDGELSLSKVKENDVIQQFAEPLVDDKCDVIIKNNTLEENEDKDPSRETAFSTLNSITSTEATTSRDNTPILSNDMESGSSSSNQNKFKRTISKAQVNSDSYDDINSFDQESSKHQKLNEDACNKSRSEDKTINDAESLRNSANSCSDRILEDVEMRPGMEEIEASKEERNCEEGLEVDIDDLAGEEECEGDTKEPKDWLPPCLKKKRPKPNWFLVPDLVHREMGISPLFQRRFYGSLHVVEHFKLTHQLREHEGCVNALNFNKNGNLLASGSDDLAVVVWDWVLGRKNHSFDSGHRSNIFQVKWLHDAEHLMATCARDGQVRLLDMGSGVSRKLATHNAPTHKLALHPDTPHVIISVGEDSKVLSIDIREEKPTKLLMVKDGLSHVQLYSVHSNPFKSTEFCVGGRSPCVKVYDRRDTTKLLYEFSPKHLSGNKRVHVTCALYNYNGTEILASYNDEDIYLFDVVLPPLGDFSHKYEGHRNNATVKGVNFFGPKSEFVISGSDCKNIFIWEKNTEAIVNWMTGDENGVVNCLEPHPHIPILATSGLDCDVKVWMPSTKNSLSLEDLKTCVATNAMNRTQETNNDSDGFDSQMLWILLTHIRHTERTRNFHARRGSSDQNRDDDDDDDDEDDDNADVSLDDDSSDDSDSQIVGNGIRRLQCPPS